MKLFSIKNFSITLFVVGLIVVIGASKSRPPLVQPNQWTVTGPAALIPPLDRYLTSKDIYESESLRLWSDFANGHANQVQVLSQTFSTPPYLSFLYAEGQNNRHDSLFLECLSTGKRLPLISEQTNGSFVERTVRIDLDECGAQARFVFENNGDYFSAFGTPYRANVFHYLKYSVLTSVFYFQIAFGLFLLIYCFCYSINTYLPKKFSVPWGTIVIFGLLSYIYFFTYWLSKELGHFVCVLTCFSGIFILRRNNKIGHFRRENARWLTLVYSFGILLTMILWLENTGNFSWLPSTRFSPAEWSSDNILPIFTAKAFLNGEPLKGLFGAWEITDRPPLFTGAVLASSTLWEAFRQLGLGDLGLPVMFAYALILNSLWIYPVIYWRRTLSLSQKESAFVIGALFSTGFIIFNTVYTWPKLLTVFLAFPSAIMVFRLFFRKALQPRFLYWSTIGGALALQTHGGVIFYLFAVTLVFLARPNLLVQNIKILGFIFLSVIAIWIPWVLFEKLVLPSSSPLVKLGFAGTFGWESKLSTSQLIMSRYSSLTFPDWLGMKWLGLKNWCGYFQEINYPELFQNNSLAGIIRKIQQTSLLPSLLPFLLVAPALFSKNKTATSIRKLLIPFLYLGVAAQVINLIITWSHHVVGHNSYPAIFCLFLVFTVASVKLLPRPWLLFLVLVSSTPWILCELVVKTQVPIFNQFLILIFLALIFIELLNTKRNNLPPPEGFV